MRTRAIVLFALLLAACSAVDDLKPRAPDVAADVSVTNITPTGVDFLVEVDVMNPNEIDLQARLEDASVVLDRRYDMGTVAIPQEISLPSDRQVHVMVPVTVDWVNVSVLASLIDLERDVPYQIDGQLKVGVDLFKVEVHFHVSDVITVEQLRQAIGRPDSSSASSR